MDQQNETISKRSPARSTGELIALTWKQVEQIDQCVADLCKHGFGELTIAVVKGKPRFLKPSRSLELSP